MSGKTVSRNVTRWFFTMAVSAGLLALVVSGVSARSFRLGKLPDQGKAFGCATCHVNPRGGGPRGPFGRDYERRIRSSGDSYAPELGAMDSDNDGFSNDKEFAAGTHPGDANSHP